MIYKYLKIFVNIFNKLKNEGKIHVKNIKIINPKKQIIHNTNKILYFGIFNSRCKILPKHFIHINGDTLVVDRFYTDTKIYLDKALLILHPWKFKMPVFTRKIKIQG